MPTSTVFVPNQDSSLVAASYQEHSMVSQCKGQCVKGSTSPLQYLSFCHHNVGRNVDSLSLEIGPDPAPLCLSLPIDIIIPHLYTRRLIGIAFGSFAGWLDVVTIIFFKSFLRRVLGFGDSWVGSPCVRRTYEIAWKICSVHYSVLLGKNRNSWVLETILQSSNLRIFTSLL